MLARISIPALALVCITVQAQSETKPFVPKGYTVLHQNNGDLNKDGRPDYALVLKQDNEDNSADELKRPLLLLVRQENGKLAQAARNDNVVLCRQCGGVFGDPFAGIVIKNGYFSVEHYGGSSWRWTRIITFRYNAADKRWYLHKDGGESFHVSDPDKVTEKVRTVKDFGRVPFEKYELNDM